MSGVLWSDSPYGLFTFIVITLIIGGAGAWATGRALARTWRPLGMVAAYTVGLAAAVRFLHFALYGEPLLSIQFFAIAYVWTLIVGLIGYRQMRAAQMATQYSWVYEKAGFGWRAKGSA